MSRTKISEEDVQSYIEANNKAGLQLTKIIKQITHVVDVICKTFFGKRTVKIEWYFNNAAEGELGTPETCELENDDPWEQISLYICFSEKRYGGFFSSSPLTLETYCWDYHYGFPRQFLFMNDYEIVAFLKEEIEETKKRNATKIKRAKAAREKKAKLKKKALSKLTKEDKKVLGIK